MPLPLEADRFSGRYRGLDLRIERVDGVRAARAARSAPTRCSCGSIRRRDPATPIGGWVAAVAALADAARERPKCRARPGTWKLAVTATGAKVADLVDDLVLVFELRARKS